jgi:hypothetical protein
MRVALMVVLCAAVAAFSPHVRAQDSQNDNPSVTAVDASVHADADDQERSQDHSMPENPFRPPNNLDGPFLRTIKQSATDASWTTYSDPLLRGEVTGASTANNQSLAASGYPRFQPAKQPSEISFWPDRSPFGDASLLGESDSSGLGRLTSPSKALPRQPSDTMRSGQVGMRSHVTRDLSETQDSVFAPPFGRGLARNQIGLAGTAVGAPPKSIRSRSSNQTSSRYWRRARERRGTP